MLAEWLSWWLRQLRELLPERWRGDGAPGSNGIVLDAGTPGQLGLARRRRGTEARLAVLRPDETGRLRGLLAQHARTEPVLLRLPPGMALERDVALPLAAERDPERVLGYELERLTPFVPADVFWAWALRERDRARGRLLLRLTLVPRALVQPLIDLAAAAGARLSLIEAPMAEGPPRAILMRHEAAPARARLLRRAALGAAVAALFVLVALPFIRQQMALDAVQDRLRVLAPRIAQVAQLRQRIARAGAGQDAIAAETRRVGDPLLALAALTEILPDDTHLTEFTMRERKITLNGLSASAPRLISLLSNDPRVRNPAFTAPITRSDTTHDDVFSLRAELAP